MSWIFKKFIEILVLLRYNEKLHFNLFLVLHLNLIKTHLLYKALKALHVYKI